MSPAVKKVFEYIVGQPKLHASAEAQFAVVEYIAAAEGELAVAGTTAEHKAEVFKWVQSALAHADKADLAGAKELDATLLRTTYLASTHAVSAADVFNFVAFHPFLSGNAKSLVAQLPNVYRWFDLMQHTIPGAAEWKGAIAIDQATPVNGAAAVAPKGKAPAVAATVLATTDANEAKRQAKIAKKEAKKDAKKEAKEAKKADAAAVEAEAPAAAPAAAAPAPAKKEAKKAEQPAKKAAAPAPAAAASAELDPTRLDIRVGFIEVAEKHADAESLYVEKIAMGDDEPRTVVSGLVHHIPLDQMQKRPCVVLANLKPVAMRGVKSHAMVLCTTSEEGKVELLAPPKGSKPGDRIAFDGIEGGAGPDAVLNPKKKVFESLAPFLQTNADKVAGFVKADGTFCAMTVPAGVVVAPTVAGGLIK
ncbi:methionine-tRNA ligase, beta subunit [Allomyces macrogynus ATCC 38327]|uniref:Methionine-tRNA ligase, beta subunit n=1 Tax=Allomyces macrogynus (strain ATCC 38327) TaxID=578462 RepID=A0A0L0SPC4_ALLM3|nr:methionine-tRNA ligase, beta subunit [Allomyces macrogynus ATCC 38327]|eukprot:KNE64337.1 methionine-tRNA ligase, beta subunit [Allomyces macrogynus ATCC 38327]